MSSVIDPPDSPAASDAGGQASAAVPAVRPPAAVEQEPAARAPERSGTPGHPGGVRSGAGRARRAVRPVLRLVGALLVPLTLVGAVVAGIAWYFTGVAVARTDHRPSYDLTVQSLSAGRVVLSRTSDSLLPGRYRLDWDGGHGTVGGILASSALSVTRSFRPAAGRPVTAGTAAELQLSPQPGDPASALGLAWRSEPIPTELGPMPAWYVPADRPAATWVLFVHGHDSSPAESLRYLPLLHRLGVPVLAPRFRNDAGAPVSPDGVEHLGDTEWRDVEAAGLWALSHGARRLVLFGWSMGGAISMQLADRSAIAPAVSGLVLDSPVLDWRTELVHQGSVRSLPEPVSRLTCWVIEHRIGIDLDRYDWVARATELRRPTLVLHSADDDFVPVGPSRALAARRPDLVTLQEFPGAGHTGGWNVDSDRYEKVLTEWLARQGVGVDVLGAAERS